MSPWAVVIFTALATLMLRALVAWLIGHYFRTTTGGAAAECDADLGDAGSGDTRISLFEGPALQKWRHRLTRRS